MALSCLAGLISVSGNNANANEIRIPRSISCSRGSVIITQTSPVQTYEQTSTAAFALSVNGSKEAATGMANGSISTVTSKNYYVFSGSGGLTFAKHRGKPYLETTGMLR